MSKRSKKAKARTTPRLPQEVVQRLRQGGRHTDRRREASRRAARGRVRREDW